MARFFSPGDAEAGLSVELATRFQALVDDYVATKYPRRESAPASASASRG